jgi:endonuclease G
VSVLTDLVSLKPVLGAAWLARGCCAGVTAMQPLRQLAAAAARAPHAVHGIGVGPKQVAGVLTTTLAIRIYVVQKLARRALALRDRLPATIDGLPVDVVEAAPAFVRNGVPLERQRRDPMCSGISIGRDGVEFGTLGAFCRSLMPEDADQVLVLSNRHVLAGVDGRANDPVFQPGPGDATGGSLRQVGTLLRAWPIEPGIIANRIDAAVATVSGAGHTLSLPGDAGRIFSVGVARANIIVCKFGRTTGLTEGVISDLKCTAVVGFDTSHPDRTATFIDQIRIDRRPGAALFADGGDSGAVILEQGNGKVVGLFFAGPIDGSYGLANHIADVTDRLQIALLLN